VSQDKHIGYQEPEPDALQQGYERSEVSQRAMLALLIGFVVSFAAILGGLWWLYDRETRHAERGERRSALDLAPVTDAPPLQPQPGHESIDAWDLRKMRDQENETFKQLGWPEDPTHHRFAVPPAIVESLRQKQAATRSGRP
jgi:hypothetical protein